MPDEALRVLAASFEALLRRCGTPCPAQQTWQEHLGEIQNSKSEIQNGRGVAKRGSLDFGQATAFVSRYNAIRFRTPNDRDAIAALAGALDALEQQTDR